MKKQWNRLVMLQEVSSLNASSCSCPVSNHNTCMLLYFFIRQAKEMSSLPSFKIKFQGVFFTFYRGIVAYSLFRKGSGQTLLNEGNEALSKLQAWRQSW